MRGRVIGAVAAAVAVTLALVGGTAAVVRAANDSTTISCSLADGSTSQTVTCEIPKPAPVTETVTVTATPTPDPKPTPSDPPSSSSPTPSVSPTPSATPTATPTQEPTVLPTGFPDASNTGVPAGATLKRVPQDASSGPGWHYDSRGWLVIDGAGATFSGFDVNVDISVEASNVTIRGNRLTSRGWPIALRHTKGVVIDRNTIGGTSATSECDNAIRGIYGDDDAVTITRNNIQFCSSGINHLNMGGRIADNYIHDIVLDASGQRHLNGIQLGAGTGPLMTIDHNTILVNNSQTDAIMLANDDGAQRNRTITNNLIGGGGYTFYGAGGPSGSATGITFTGNQFTTRYYPRGGYWGPVAYWKSGNTWANNTWADGPNAGKPVTP